MHDISFDAEKHEYWLTEDESRSKLISVTQLLKKHGLSTDYSNVPKDILSAKAELGTAIHAEIEDYIKFNELPHSEEAKAVVKWLKPLEKNGAVTSELIVYNKMCAGTIDLVIATDKALIIGDIKTCYSLNIESYRWQLSLYARLLQCCHNMKADKLVILHASASAKKLVHEITPISDAEIDRLLDCERNGNIYTLPVLTIEEDELQTLIEAESAVTAIEKQAKEATEYRDNLRAKILARMNSEGISKFEGRELVLTRIASTERKTIDAKALRAEMPEIADKYTRATQIKESLRVSIKKEDKAI